VVLAALVAFVWMNLSKSRKSISLADVEAAKATHEAAPELSVAAKFIKESFTVNLADTAASHFAKVDVEIEVDDDFVRGEVERLKPRIRDFIVVILSSKTYDQIASVDGRDFLREEIRNKINGYLTRGQIKNVYFTQFIIQ
jgi:flagellar FliL protein